MPISCGHNLIGIDPRASGTWIHVQRSHKSFYPLGKPSFVEEVEAFPLPHSFRLWHGSGLLRCSTAIGFKLGMGMIHSWQSRYSYWAATKLY